MSISDFTLHILKCANTQMEMAVCKCLNISILYTQALEITTNPRQICLLLNFCSLLLFFLHFHLRPPFSPLVHKQSPCVCLASGPIDFFLLGKRQHLNIRLRGLRGASFVVSFPLRVFCAFCCFLFTAADRVPHR